jgi:hypothetical protein
VCNKEDPELRNNRWRAIMGLDRIVSEAEAQRQAEIQQQLKELGERIQAPIIRHTRPRSDLKV